MARTRARRRPRRSIRAFGAGGRSGDAFCRRRIRHVRTNPTVDRSRRIIADGTLRTAGDGAARRSDPRKIPLDRSGRPRLFRKAHRAGTARRGIGAGVGVGRSDDAARSRSAASTRCVLNATCYGASSMPRHWHAASSNERAEPPPARQGRQTSPRPRRERHAPRARRRARPESSGSSRAGARRRNADGCGDRRGGRRTIRGRLRTKRGRIWTRSSSGWRNAAS